MKKPILLLFAIFAFAINGFSQDNSWRKAENSDVAAESKLPRDTQLKAFLVYELNLSEIKTKLAASPKRSATAVSNVILSFPNPQGEMQSFKMYEASNMEESLALNHSEIQSYVGKCIEDPTATITITTTIFGFHAITHSGKNGTSYIDPYTKDLNTYVVYSRNELSSSRKLNCGSINDELRTEIPESQNLIRANNSILKTYRMAMSCTIEYAQFHVSAANLNSGTLAQKKSAVLAAMNITVSRINSVYERDHALRMVLVANNEAIINIISDDLDNDNAPPTFPLLDQNQAFIDFVIGNTNYDIGHCATTGAGGVATSGCVCDDTIKARGVTGVNAPVGDPYDIDYVAHEVGHQFGGSHTFNSIAYNCGGNNRISSSAYEPGSGTTIQAYAGICTPENVQQNSDAYFHARSLIQMNAQINAAGTNCASQQPNGNTAPVIFNNGNLTSSNSSIPSGTAFKLTGSATDVDNPSGNQLTYCWEHYNQTSVSVALAPTNVSGPNFRSLSPTTSPERYFPKLATVVANSLASTWEVVPTVARIMTFSLVVRDNGGPLGGQTQRVTKTVTLVGTTPFKVTSQTAIEGWAQNSSQIVTWDVASSDIAPISTPNVNIRLSTDGGLTFPTFLATNVPNDGSEVVTAPNLVSQTCRIMVEGAGNVFYAVNISNFYIGYSISNNCTNYLSNTTADNVTPFTIPDNSISYTQKKFVVPTTTNLILDVNFTITATHPNLQNLQLAYVRPGGSLQTFFNQQCAGNANMNVTFDSQGTAFTCANPTTGTYALPVGTLNTLNGLNPTGTWIFAFKDIVAGNVGSIDSISLQICSQVVTLLANDTFNFENFAIFPNPNNGDFTIKFDSGSNSKISIIVNDLQGRKVYEKNYENSGLFSENLQLDKTQKGIYLVTIKDGEKQIVKKIVIE